MDIVHVKYKVILMIETGEKWDITQVVTSLPWEENERELATRINVVLRNVVCKGKRLSSYAKLNCMIAILASIGNGYEEVARGKITDWDSNLTSSEQLLSITAYDNLYDLQQSQDNIYYSAGLGTGSLLKEIFKKWGLQVTYLGTDVKHSKVVYKNSSISDAILGILKEASRKGAKKCVIRSEKGRIIIRPKGSNKEIYNFNANNTIASSNRQSTANMVTRVKVVAQESSSTKSNKKKAVKGINTVVDGKIEYGIRQKLHTSSSDDTLESATKAAKEILKESGSIEKELSIQAPDFPFLRKGDKVHVTVGSLNGDFYIKGIQHEAYGTMTIELERV